mmetsp:Transcript_2431/g.7752  ORF Transcript_2431/g.7752 Transcript_2431/m.7752 type:complete len:209 (-) Transcript_2431:158-784(-)
MTHRHSSCSPAARATHSTWWLAQSRQERDRPTADPLPRYSSHAWPCQSAAQTHSPPAHRPCGKLQSEADETHGGSGSEATCWCGYSLMKCSEAEPSTSTDGGARSRQLVKYSEMTSPSFWSACDPLTRTRTSASGSASSSSACCASPDGRPVQDMPGMATTMLSSTGLFVDGTTRTGDNAVDTPRADATMSSDGPCTMSETGPNMESV